MSPQEQSNPTAEELREHERSKQRRVKLKFIFSASDSTIEEHAARTVKMMLRNVSPRDPRLPTAAEAYTDHYCSEGHNFWAPMSYYDRDNLCPEHRSDPQVVGKYQ